MTTRIDELLRRESARAEAAAVNALGGIRVADADDFMAVYHAWIRARPVAYRNAQLLTNPCKLNYPCRVLFHATITPMQRKVRITISAAVAPI